MGTHVDIAEKILAKEGHYFLEVKENQADCCMSEVQLADIGLYGD